MTNPPRKDNRFYE